jgi:hypothetical protein
VRWQAKRDTALDIELARFDIPPNTKIKAPSSLRFAGALQNYL